MYQLQAIGFIIPMVMRTMNDSFITKLAESAAREHRVYDEFQWTFRGFLLGDHSACGTHMIYCMMTEYLQLANVCAQMFALTKIFGQLYWQLGLDILMGCQVDNPFWEHFPSLVSCKLPLITNAGYLDKGNEVICLLPLNAVNVAIFTVQWFILTTVGLLLLVLAVYRLTCICCPQIIEVRVI